jgi:RNA polymerase sigma-70 factor (ECF subfamily)
MDGGDTTLGGGGRAFPETSLGLLGPLGNPDGPGYAQAFERLCLRYWKPVYLFLRIARAKSNDDAKELTQEFFLWLFEDPALGRFDPARGGFRPFLKTLLRRFVGHQDRDQARQKRGGGARVLSLEGDAPELPELRSDPEDAFEAAWLEELIAQALVRVRAQGPASRVRIYEAVTLAAERPTHSDVARRLGVSTGEVEKAVARVREDLRRELRILVGESAGVDAEDEWRRLLGT